MTRSDIDKAWYCFGSLNTEILWRKRTFEFKVSQQKNYEKSKNDYDSAVLELENRIIIFQ